MRASTIKICLLSSLILTATACDPAMYQGLRWNGANNAPSASAPQGGTVSPAGDANTPSTVLAATGSAKSLTRVTNGDADELWPVAAPDAKTVLYTSRVYDEANDENGNRVVKQQVIVRIDPERGTGSSKTFVTASRNRSYAPSYTPNGKHIVFVSNAMGGWNLVRSTASSAGAITVLVKSSDAPALDWPSVSPDGNRITFQTTVNETANVAVVNANGSSLTMVTEGEQPKWSPDGKQLVFARKVGDYYQVFTAEAENGGGLTQVTNNEADNTAPTFSPDGAWIVFQSALGSDRGRERFRSNLFAIKNDGTELTQITDGMSEVGAPVWSTDGWVYFHSNESGTFDIWRVRAPGAEPAEGEGNEGGVPENRTAEAPKKRGGASAGR